MNELGLTRRGVLWLGLRCDVRCEFCYQENMPSSHKTWVPLDDLKVALDKFRYYYQNEYVDFMGGEPTLHPYAVDIVRYSASIDLRPTMVTHAMRLADRRIVDDYKSAGIHDFLVSVHGIGSTVREIHRRGSDNYGKQMRALDNLRDAEIPFRFNVTVVRENLHQLVDIASLAVNRGARVVNFLTFNPYFEWTADPEIPFQVKHSEAAPELIRAIEVLDRGSVEANVRYLPLCQLPGHEANVFTGHQLPFDTHEWDYNSWYDQGHRGTPDHSWFRAASILQQKRHNYVHPEECNRCAVKGICDGVHAQYLARFGAGELRPFPGEPVTDPAYFVASQDHVALEPSALPPPIREEDSAPLTLTQFSEELDHVAGVKVELRSKQAI